MGRVLRWLIAALIVFLFTSFVLAQDKPVPARIAPRSISRLQRVSFVNKSSVVSKKE
jgi:hypothetical protein